MPKSHNRDGIFPPRLPSGFSRARSSIFLFHRPRNYRVTIISRIGRGDPVFASRDAAHLVSNGAWRLRIMTRSFHSSERLPRPKRRSSVARCLVRWSKHQTIFVFHSNNYGKRNAALFAGVENFELGTGKIENVSYVFTVGMFIRAHDVYYNRISGVKSRKNVKRKRRGEKKR